MPDTDQTNVTDANQVAGNQERDEDLEENSSSDAPQTQEEAEKQERALLMQRARMMNLSISNNIGLETLRKRIADAMEGKKDKAQDGVSAPPLVAPGTKNKAVTLRQRLLAENMRLIRCHIVNLDPKKKDLPGEIISVANDVVGTVRKYVPFGEVTENGYHIPYIIYKMLKRRKFLNIRTRKTPKGPIVEQSWAQEFAITVLDPLTPEELKRLATAQTAAGSVG